MDKIICWECSRESGNHKMGCGSKSKMEGLVFLLSEVYLVPDETLKRIMSRAAK